MQKEARKMQVGNIPAMCSRISSTIQLKMKTVHILQMEIVRGVDEDETVGILVY
jgi:hypothetical protein